MSNNIITSRTIPAKELPIGQIFTLEPGSDNRLRIIALRAVEFDSLGKPTAFALTAQPLAVELRSDEVVQRITPDTKVYPVNRVVPHRLTRVAIKTREGSVDERDAPVIPSHIERIQTGIEQNGVLRILAKVAYQGDFYHDQYIEIALHRVTGSVTVVEYATPYHQSFTHTACGTDLLHWQSEAILKAAVELGRSHWDRWE
ncbi:hypothetical protein vBSlqSZDD2_49 [Serratia phage vB_SlqS_ZDD2]|nr:hypothetical protein vBSlqSZDD2_49 [Serratia phage vB_SlqS_ZDD2]